MGQWVQKASMPTPRHDLQAITVGREIYAISGAGDETVHAVEIYDVATDTWRAGPPIPTQRGWFGAALLDGKIYAVGGKRVRPAAEKEASGQDHNFDIRDSVEVLDLQAQTWSSVESLSRPRAGLLATVCKGEIYAIGGNAMDDPKHSGSVHLDRIEIFDPQTGHWSMGAPLPVKRQGPAVATVDDKIYVTAGIGSKGDEKAGALSDHQVFDPDTQEWSELAPIPTPRCDPGVVAVGRKIYTFGGWGGSQSYHTVVEVYDIDADSWSTEESMPVRKAWMAAAEVDGRIFVMGGAHALEGGGYNWIDSMHELVA